jgi:hypothetical protein
MGKGDNIIFLDKYTVTYNIERILCCKRWKKKFLKQQLKMITDQEKREVHQLI